MFTILFLIGWATFSTLMSIYVLGGYYIILWILLGYLVGFIPIIIGALIHIYAWQKLPLMNRYKYYGWQSLARFLSVFVFNISIKVIGAENVPKDGKMVVYTNHKSYLDPVIAIQAINRPMAFTPKSTLYKIPILKDGMKQMHCMPIYRDDTRKTAKALVETIKNIETGFSMVVFPEGGRKNRDQDSVVATRAGAFQIAVKPKATILPMTIIGNSEIQHRAPFRKTKIKVIIHKPITHEDYQGLSTAEIGDMVMHVINSGFEHK
ncbi:1-acyl-sn-glycerol-3-phosphate acyltransferase [Acholeplasma laidlawii]|uniref:lysophospholipid acyltransferase family protein n=1 Tax=Acholeplasma laidlawii TaxID=2148 RepID=UPI0018C28439|nr:lysophospholipid acyltransferase family protein [Acholeplasma laidlawii]MBG0762078.1 1-acyl-sn-glycerol-3-phosphate acyltransferase [Acholeplasma laidlawii]